MRFKLKTHKEGDRRGRMKFAWWPITIDNFIVWLEWYTIEEVWRKPFAHDPHWAQVGIYLNRK